MRTRISAQRIVTFLGARRHIVRRLVILNGDGYLTGGIPFDVMQYCCLRVAALMHPALLCAGRAPLLLIDCGGQ